MPAPQSYEKGAVAASYPQVKIYEGFPFHFYEVSEPEFSGIETLIRESLVKVITGRWSLDELLSQHPEVFQKKFTEQFRETVMAPITYKELLERVPSDEDFELFRQALMRLFRIFFPQVKSPQPLADSIIGASVGYGKLAPLIADADLEEIMVNGYGQRVFVFHKRFGVCKTSLDFSNRKDLDSLLQKIARTAGRQLDADQPLLDARLPDGNRANATFSAVTPLGSTLTIRKFSAVPMSIIDLIVQNTLSSEVAAFLWVMVEGMGIEPMNLIITGGSGSGKTTTLNALAAFIRYQERIISIEDTLELQLGERENWVQMESRLRIKGQEEITMDDLLKNAMRMRPDRLIVGEVRGREAETLFIAMDTGHSGALGTLHSNSAKELMLRLKSEPMNVAEALLPLLDLIVVQYRIYVKGQGIQRRMICVSEVSSMERQALLSNVYEWDRKSDSIRRTDVPSSILEDLANKVLRSKKEVEQEMKIRKSILDWMVRNNMHSYSEVEKIIQQYYYSPEMLLQKVLSETTS